MIEPIIPIAKMLWLYNSDPLNKTSRLINMWNGGDGEPSDEGVESWYNAKIQAEQANVK